MRRFLGFALALWLGLASGSAFGAIGACTDIGHNQSTAVTSPLTMTTTAAINSGDTVCFLHYMAVNTNTMTGTPSDSVNNYSILYSQATAPGAELACVQSAVAVGSGATISMPFSGAAGNRHAISAFKVTGLSTAPDWFDQHITTSNGATTTLTVSLAQLGVPNELIVLGYFSATTPTTLVYNTAGTQVGGNTATAFAIPGCAAVTSAAAVAYQQSWTGSNNVRVTGFSFKGASQPAGGSGGMLGVFP